jgi:hypothetical protein
MSSKSSQKTQNAINNTTYITNKLNNKGYNIRVINHNETNITIQLFKDEQEVGYISFALSSQTVGQSRQTRDNIEDTVCNIGFISVSDEFKGNGLSYYLIILALLYTQTNFPNIVYSTLDDCSDKSGEVMGNLYYKLKFVDLDLSSLISSGKGVPLTKSGRQCIQSNGPERIGVIEQVVQRLLELIDKRGGRKKRNKKSRKYTRKSKKYNKKYNKTSRKYKA